MSDITPLIELNDSDILRLEAVVQRLQERQGRSTNLEAFRQEAMDRFAEAGFKVAVKVYTTDQSGTYAFDIDITDRLEGRFDPDKMVWEATHDVLDLGEGGVIRTGPTAVIEGGHGHKHRH